MGLINRSNISRACEIDKLSSREEASLTRNFNLQTQVVLEARQRNVVALFLNAAIIIRVLGLVLVRAAYVTEAF